MDTVASSLMASACVSAAATGCKNMIPRPYGVGGPGRYTNGGHRNEDLIMPEIRSTTSPVFGRDQIVTLSNSVSEIGLWPAGYKSCFFFAGSWTRSVRTCAFLGFWQRD